MNDCFWYPRDPQRFLTDTAWCDAATEVAHNRLTDTYYALGRPIKDERERLQNIGKIKDADYNRVRGNLAELGWKFTDGVLRHRRIEETLAKMESERLSQIQRTKAATEARQRQRDVERNGQRDDVADVERNGVLTTTTTTTIDTETTKATSKGESASPAPYSEILDGWNAMAKVRCLIVSDKRRQMISQRWQEKFFQDHWRKAIAKISASQFCNGENDRGWKATFDWFISRDSVVKVMEGKYDNCSAEKNTRSFIPDAK